MKKNNIELATGVVILFIIIFMYGSESVYSQKLIFSHERGIYTEPFKLEISASISSAKVKYTLDGTNPFISSTAKSANSQIQITIDPSNITDRDTAPGFIVSACSVQDDTLVDKPVSHTYLFIDKIVELSPNNKVPGKGWLVPGASSQQINYGLDPNIYNNSKFKPYINESFLSLPILSVVMDLKGLFAPDSGIYVNATKHGVQWERNASLELINHDGNKGFQINCGIRIRGGWSRHDDNPKHAFRFFFRKEYGEGKLKYELFDKEGVNEFDKIDLATAQNYSWSYYGDGSNTFLRDHFSRDTQKDMKQPHTRSRYYHLFINGTYWGLFYTQERSEASFAASYFGGIEADYDVVKVNTGEYYNLYEIEATDGNLDKYRELWNACNTGFLTDANYLKVKGMNPDGSVNPNYPKLLDEENLIDYMIITYFVGDFDGPVSDFRGNASPNNYYGIFNRINPDGFKFFRHDAEHSLFKYRGVDRTGPYNAGINFREFNPQWLHQKLMSNNHYKLKFADRVFRHFFGTSQEAGVLTRGANTNRIMARKNQIDKAIISESARWGDSKRSVARTKDDWENAVSFILNDYLIDRNDVVLKQFKAKGWYPSFNPPTIDTANSKIIMNKQGGEIYYTKDGSDPYSQFTINNISPAAIKYESPIEIEHNLHIKARVNYNNTWSAVNEISPYIFHDLNSIKVTELHYNPMVEDTTDSRELEFIELKNIGPAQVNLKGSAFVNGISYEFARDLLMNTGEFVVLSSNKVEFKKRYGFDSYDEYEGQLDNSGERVSFISSSKDTVLNFRYNDKLPWPVEADGKGYSLVSKSKNPIGDPNDAGYWSKSEAIHGSPGRDDLISSFRDEQNLIPAQIQLFQNYPNPFNPETVITYQLSETSDVSLKVYDILGRELAVLVNKTQQPGFHSVKFSVSKIKENSNFNSISSSISSGIFFYRLHVGNFSEVKKMIFLK